MYLNIRVEITLLFAFQMESYTLLPCQIFQAATR